MFGFAKKRIIVRLVSQPRIARSNMTRVMYSDVKRLMIKRLSC